MSCSIALLLHFVVIMNTVELEIKKYTAYVKNFEHLNSACMVCMKMKFYKMIKIFVCKIKIYTLNLSKLP